MKASYPKIEGYKITESIGKGSFGHAYKGIRLSDEKECAIKKINYSTMSKKEKEMLVNECNILRHLNSDYIVRYYDRIIDKANKIIYLIMEYCSYGDLQNFITKSTKNIPEDQIWLSLAELSSALKSCHCGDDKIIHRDIKPANIFIDKTGHVKLGDFGLAKAIPKGLTDTYLGTPLYMSPEIIGHRGYDEKSDIWALGCVIYQMAARDPPFRAYGQEQLNREIKYSDIKPIPKEYSDDLWNLIRKMLDKDPKKRPSAEELTNFKTIRLTLEIENLKKKRRLVKAETEKYKQRAIHLEEEIKKAKEAKHRENKKDVEELEEENLTEIQL